MHKRVFSELLWHFRRVSLRSVWPGRNKSGAEQSGDVKTRVHRSRGLPRR